MGQDESNAGRQRDLSVLYEKVGGVLEAQGQLSEALDAYEQDLTIAKRLAEQDKSNWDRQRDLAISYQKVGDVFRAQGKLDQAIAHYTKAVQLDPDDSDAYFGRAFANQIIANFRGALRDFVRYLPTSANAWRRNRQM